MKAIVIHGVQDFRLDTIDKPVPGEGEVLIKIEATGICAGDRATYDGTAPWGTTPGLVQGHEYVGIVSELGKGAAEETGLVVGDRITAEVQVPCMKCYYCRHGLRNLCTDPDGLLIGSWAEYMIIRKGAVIHKVPKEIDKIAAAVIEPLTCGAHAVERAEISMKDTVVISGMGAIGLSVLQFAKLRTPYKLIGVDTNNAMLEVAKKLGADYIFNPIYDDVKKEVEKLTDGLGVDVYIEASGNVIALAAGLDVLRKRGRLVSYGVYKKRANLDFNQVSENKELEIRGGHLSPDTYPFVIRAIQKGLVDPLALVTDVYPFSQFEDAIHAKERNIQSIKTVMIP